MQVKQICNEYDNFMKSKFKTLTINCSKHGKIDVIVFKDTNVEDVICPFCEEDEKHKQDENENTAERIKTYISLGLYEEHYNAELSNFFPPNEKAKQYLETIKLYSENPGRRCLLFYGNSGTGKSKLLSALVKKFQGHYITYERLSLKIRASYSSSSMINEEDLIDKFVAIPFLAIDEIDKGVGSDAKYNWLSLIVRERHERRRPTALAGNCDWQWIKTAFEGSIIDRWTQTGLSFNFDWESYRPNLRNLKEI